MPEYNAIFRWFRFSGTLGKPRDVYAKTQKKKLTVKLTFPFVCEQQKHHKKYAYYVLLRPEDVKPRVPKFHYTPICAD